MYPTMFNIPFLPQWLGEIKSYGVMMMIAFLTGIWLACRRAERSQANPDTVLNIGFIALIFGVIGARTMFVIHYWDTRFANQASPILAVLNIRGGGLEFWGGPLLVIPAVYVYLRFVAKASARWYLDITAPSLAWGLAITRIGCFLNGCCWGAVCVDEHDPALAKAAVPWAVRFPYGSPAMRQQYQFGQTTVPKELIYTTYASGESYPLPREWIVDLIEDGGEARAALEAAQKAALETYRKRAAAGANGDTLAALRKKSAATAQALSNYHRNTELGLADAQCRKYGLAPAQFLHLADSYCSKPVHPAQLYAVINGMIISWLLAVLFYRRRRHGIVLGWFLILYSVSRVFLELIRQDNPLDTAGVTISQAISLCTLLAGVAWVWIMCRLPVRSPLAVAFVPPEEYDPKPRKAPMARKR